METEFLTFFLVLTYKYFRKSFILFLVFVPFALGLTAKKREWLHFLYIFVMEMVRTRCALPF